MMMMMSEVGARQSVVGSLVIVGAGVAKRGI